MTVIATEPRNASSLVDDMERHARKRTQALENASKLPAGFTAMYHPETPTEAREGRRLYAALMLADSAETFVALVKKEAVPRHRLNQDYLAVLERWPTPDG